MAETVTPIRPLDEAAALEWLRAQPGARTNLPAAELARRWGWHRQRAGRRIKAWQKAGLVTCRGNTVTATDGTPRNAGRPGATKPSQHAGHPAEIHVPVLPSVTSYAPVLETVPAPAVVTSQAASPVTGGSHVTAYAAAIALAGAAAWFSIRGMVVLFPGSPLSVIGMAVAMEGAKLVTAGWLARHWRTTPWLWRAVLAVLVAGLAVINGVGVFSQLVAAHVGERGAATAALESREGEIAAKIEIAAGKVADLDRQIGQIDTAIETAAKKGKTNVALSAMDGQKKTRAGLVDARNREAAALATLKAERAQVTAKGKQAETEAAPIMYVAEMLGVGTDSEKAIRWLILLMVLCCDPLAIALTAAASARRSA